MLDKNSDLVKGFYNLFNGDNKEGGIKYHKKKGSDIKQALNNVIMQTNKEKSDYLDKMKAESDELSFVPDVECEISYEYKHLFEYIPKKFSYDMLYHGERYVRTDRGIEEQAIRKPTDEERQEMHEYNRYVQKYIDMCINKIKLDTLRKNIQENKTYSLSIDQLSILGL